MNRPIMIFSLMCIALAVTGCGTFFNVRMSSPATTLEGKDYTVQFTLANEDKAVSISLYYRVNDQPFAVVEPVRRGSLREFVIPAAELAPGRLEYYVVVRDKDGKEHREGAMTVAVLSRAEGRAAAEADIVRRLVFTPPVEGSVIDDLDFTLRLQRPLGGPEITLFLKAPSDTQFRGVALAPQAGEYRYRIAARDLEEGRLLYYFRIGETHPDFGRLTVTHPREADSRPLAANITGLSELAARLDRELAQAIVHTPVDEALETEDLRLAFTLDVPPGGLLQKLLLDRPKAALYYGRRAATTRYRTTAMVADAQGRYQAVIDRRALAAGTDCYYFAVSAQTRDVGPIEAVNPAGAGTTPHSFKLVTVGELRARRERQLAGQTTHTPPDRALMTGPLELPVSMPETTAVRRGVLHFRRASERRFREVALASTREGFLASIPRDALEAGVLEYYFTISLDFPDIGAIRYDVPRGGTAEAFTVSVEDVKTTLRGLEDGMRRRLRHTPVTEVVEGKNAELTLSVQNLTATTEAMLFLQRDRARGTIARKMTRRAGGFAAMIEAGELREGYTRYHLEVSEPHAFFKTVMVAFPEEGRTKPYEITVVKAITSATPEKPVTVDKPDTNDGNGRAVIPAVEFDPPVTITAGKRYGMRLKIKDPAAGLKVSLAFRRAGADMPYTVRLMKQTGVNYSTDLDEVVLVAGAKIEYYFILEPAGAAEPVTWPAADKLPLSFVVQETAKDADRGRGRGR